MGGLRNWALGACEIGAIAGIMKGGKFSATRSELLSPIGVGREAERIINFNVPHALFYRAPVLFFAC